MFSGQGTQYYQMGKDLYENVPFFKHELDWADEKASSLLGFSLIKEIYNPNHTIHDNFDDIQITHPSLLIIQYALTKLLIEMGVQPTKCLGSSLGEYIAAIFAGIFSFDEALKILIFQAKLFSARCSSGRMMAVIDDPIIFENFLKNKSELVGVNFSSHFVISMPTDHLQNMKEILTSKQISFRLLPVKLGFHSQLLDVAKEEFLLYLNSISMSDPKLPLISCAQSDILSKVHINHFWDCVRKPILFRETILKLESGQEYNYVDIGPSGTLSTFVKYNLSSESKSSFFSIMTPFGQDTKNFNKVCQQLAN